MKGNSYNVGLSSANLNKQELCDKIKEHIPNLNVFHDFGKIGSLEADYYLSQDSNWHRERGMMYKYNDQLQYISGPNVWRNMHKYRGGYDASVAPTLVDGVGKLSDYYEVTVAGSPDFGSGAVVLAVGDVLKYNGAVWIKA